MGQDCKVDVTLRPRSGKVDVTLRPRSGKVDVILRPRSGKVHVMTSRWSSHSASLVPCVLGRDSEAAFVDLTLRPAFASYISIPDISILILVCYDRCGKMARWT